jgi:hypothetical protein
MTGYNKGDQVTITNIAGLTEDETTEAHYRIIGQTGYVRELSTGDWVYVTIPSHLYYSKGKGAALKASELVKV